MSAYRFDHRRLLTDIGTPSASTNRHKPLRRPPIGAIIVPTSRSFREDLPGIRLAAVLAEKVDAVVLIICSGAARPTDFPPDVGRQLSGRLFFLELGRMHPDWHPALASANQKACESHKQTDTGRKRNLGICLATALDWEFVLFLDDDVFMVPGRRTLTPEQLVHAATSMTEHPDLRAVGWSASDYPDNSVIGHARRHLGRRQHIFLGAGALLVRCAPAVSFFPAVYNEDWLFLIAMAASSERPAQAIGWAGDVGQRPYCPFEAERARSEEAGDLIGEGVLNLLEDHLGDFERGSTRSYWEACLRERRRLIRRLLTTNRFLTLSGDWFVPGAHTGKPLAASLQAALEESAALDAGALQTFVRVWRHDELAWRLHLEAIRQSAGPLPDPASGLAAVAAGRSPANWLQRGRAWRRPA